MKIAFDHQIFLLQSYGGISRYICNLAARISDLNHPPKVEICAPIHFNRNLLDLPKKISKNYFVKRPDSTKLATGISMLSGCLSSQAIKRFDPDIIHETYYSNHVSFQARSKVVVTVHDMIHEKFSKMLPNAMATTRLKSAAVNRADHVICISENTKIDLMDLFKTPENKISVIHHGVDDIFYSSERMNLDVLYKTSPYILFVGSREGYKNFTLLLEAYASSNWLMTNFSIVCFGGGAFTEHELSYATSLGLSLKKLCHYFGGDQILTRLYQGASVLVYPSLYEGFGFPPLEAMASQCPVIASHSSSLPEIAGDAAEYFDPSNSESLSHAMEKVLTSESHAKSLVMRGNINVARFSWSKCAKETFSVYENIKG